MLTFLLFPSQVWIFGGGFHSGGAADRSEQGAIFAEQQDVVVVNLNYRLGLLGFPGAPNLTQNLGLLDQRLALEWVRDNIAGFGGDPEKITLFGHSAGGASIDFYNFAWTADPIISSSIIMSGNVFSFGNRFTNTSALSWYTATTLVGCGNSTTSSDIDILACMRTKDANAFVKISSEVEGAVSKEIGKAGAEYEGVTGPFGPTIDNVTIFENYTIRGQQRQFIQAPIITGNNDDEGCFFAEKGQIPDSYEDRLTEVIFTCPTYDTANARIDAALPVWKYRWFGMRSLARSTTDFLSRWLLTCRKGRIRTCTQTPVLAVLGTVQKSTSSLALRALLRGSTRRRWRMKLAGKIHSGPSPALPDTNICLPFFSVLSRLLLTLRQVSARCFRDLRT